MRLLGVAMLIVCSYASQANADEGPVYRRHRTAADYGYAPGNGSAWGPAWQYPGYPVVGLGFYQQPTSGYWFERPYPYHLDYYRGRFNSPPPSQGRPCAASSEPTPAARLTPIERNRD